MLVGLLRFELGPYEPVPFNFDIQNSVINNCSISGGGCRKIQSVLSYSFLSHQSYDTCLLRRDHNLSRAL